MRRILSIDHGNRLIKTEGIHFPASFVEGAHLLFEGGNSLKRGGKSYILADGSLPVLNDKTVCERYYVLTLASIGKAYLKV